MVEECLAGNAVWMFFGEIYKRSLMPRWSIKCLREKKGLELRRPITAQPIHATCHPRVIYYFREGVHCTGRFHRAHSMSLLVARVLLRFPNVSTILTSSNGDPLKFLPTTGLLSCAHSPILVPFPSVHTANSQRALGKQRNFSSE